MATTLKHKQVKIRKPRQCFSCYRKFQKGQIMTYWAGIYEGDFGTTYSCMDCQKIMNDSDEHEFEEGFVWEGKNQGESIDELIIRLLKTSYYEGTTTERSSSGVLG